MTAARALPPVLRDAPVADGRRTRPARRVRRLPLDLRNITVHQTRTVALANITAQTGATR